MSDQEKRTRIEEHLAEILDGDAPADLYDLIAGDDECRDLRHDAEQAVALIHYAGADYVVPDNLETNVLATLDARQGVTETPPAAPAPEVAQVQPPAPPDATGGAIEANDPAPATQRMEERGQTAPIAASVPAHPLGAETAPNAAPQPTALVESQSTSHGPRVIELAKRHKWWLLGGGSVATFGALAASVLVLFLLREHLPDIGLGSSEWQGEVTSVAQAGGEGSLEVCDHAGESCRTASAGDPIPAGATIRTDATVRAHLELADGTQLSLDRDTQLVLAGSGREARLDRGAIVADVAHREGERARIDVPLGRIEVLGTKFGLRADRNSATVDVSRGRVRLEDESEHAVTVHAGEEGRLFRGQPPYAAATTLLGEAIAWSDQIREDAREEIPSRGLGELRAKKPGETDERKGAVTLASHQVKVRISGAVARTEVEEVFDNQTSEVLEGIYRFPLPPDAKIERLALEVDGKLEEGAFVDRDRAAAIWRGSIVNAAPEARQHMQDEIVWVPGPWRDPALLEWQRGSRFELRIYPIPANGSRRVVLAYTQVIKPTGGVRRYTYPLAHDPSGSTRVGDFGVDVQVRGHDESFTVQARGYSLRQQSNGTTETLQLSEKNFVPTGDLMVEYALPNRDDELTAWAYQPDSRPASTVPSDNAEPHPDTSYPYVALALRPKLPRVANDQQRAYAFVVDSSRSMYGESFKRASRLTARMVRELDEGDFFTVLACDTTCRQLPGGLQEPSPGQARTVETWLDSVQPEGASDPTAGIREARSATSEVTDREIRILYVGDGTPTAGPIRPAYITRAVQDAVPSDRGTVTAVAIGADSDLESLQALARGGGGVVLPYIPGQTTAEAAYAALGMTYGQALRDVRVELPSGMVEVAPAQVDTIPAGGESIIVARMTKPTLEGTVVLRGKLGQREFEQRYPVKLAASKSPGNAFVPRLYAATRIADLERRADAEAKREAIELSSRFDVASRYTSLLVLESAAMFKAFGLDNTRQTPDWSGEEETDATSASGSIAYDDVEEEKAKKESADWTLGSNFGAGGLGLSGVAGRAKAAPKPAATPMRPGAAAPAAPRTATAGDAWNNWSPRAEEADVAADPLSPLDAEPPPPPPEWGSRRSWVAMRRVWDRRGQVTTGSGVPKVANVANIAEAERDYEAHPNRRGAVRKLYVLYALSGDLRRASDLAEHWSEKDPLDPEALTARADLAAQRGDRELAIRVLGSVVDVRPGDVKAQKRLARLHRWAGRPALGCRHAIAISQLRQEDADLLADAVRCARETGERHLATEMLAAVAPETREATAKKLESAVNDTELSGDFQLEATWGGGGHDLDLGLLHPDGHRVSWLGAPTRSVITATDVTSTNREGLALRGAKPGEYVIEVVRALGAGPVSGEVTVRVAGERRVIPFALDGNRTTLGVARISMHSRLVPAR